jgi:hypothetical protein
MLRPWEETGGKKRAGGKGRKEKGGRKRVRGKGREEKGGKKKAGEKGREEKGGKTIELESKYISQLKIKIHGQIKSQSVKLVFECWSDSLIVVSSPINIAIVVIVVVDVVIAGIGVAVVEPRRVSTRGLRLRVAQAGAIVGHDALESPATRPQPTAGLVEVRTRRAILLVPSKCTLTPIDEEAVPSRAVVGMPQGIPPLLWRELEVVVVRDGHLAHHTYRDRRDRYSSDAQHPADGDAVDRRAWVRYDGSHGRE